MGNLERLFAENSKAAGCKFQRIMTGLDTEDQQALTDALESELVSNMVISRVLREVGQTVSETQVRRHRTNECACRN